MMASLAREIGELTEEHPMAAAVWDTVVCLERSLGVPLGAADHSIVALWRQFARVHGAWLDRPVDDGDREASTSLAIRLLEDLSR